MSSSGRRLIITLPISYAQEYVSVAELHDQAQAMGGVWQETFDTPSGEMAVDVKIEFPDVEKLPVITVDKAKISEELFNQIAAMMMARLLKLLPMDMILDMNPFTLP